MPAPLVTESISPITPQVIGTAEATVYTNATNNVLVKSLVFFNDTAGPVVLKLWNHLSGGSANQAAKILEETIPAKTPLEVPFTFLTQAGGACKAQADTLASISVQGFVIEYAEAA